MTRRLGIFMMVVATATSLFSQSVWRGTLGPQSSIYGAATIVVIAIFGAAIYIYIYI